MVTQMHQKSWQHATNTSLLSISYRLQEAADLQEFHQPEPEVTLMVELLVVRTQSKPCSNHH